MLNRLIRTEHNDLKILSSQDPTENTMPDSIFSMISTECREDDALSGDNLPSPSITVSSLLHEEKFIYLREYFNVHEVITITRGYTISTWNLMIIDYVSMVAEQAVCLLRPSGAMPEVLRIFDPHVFQTLSLPD